MPQGSNFFKTYKKSPGIANIFLVKKNIFKPYGE